jgi:hypothetical protein
VIGRAVGLGDPEKASPRGKDEQDKQRDRHRDGNGEDQVERWMGYELADRAGFLVRR